MKNRITIVITSFFLMLCLSQRTYGQNYKQIDSYKGKKIDALFNEWITEKSPGASVAIIDNSKIVFANSYGFASLEFNIKNTPQTLFNINSNSKQFTTFALMNLVNQGALSLNDDVRKYIPELPDFGKEITVRNLAQHTHGIRGITPLLGMAGWSIEDLVSRADVLRLLTQQKDLDFSPGTNFSYNNTGYMLLAEIVERVSGESFHTYLDKIIFTPLGMNSTQLLEDHEKVIPNMSSPYYFDGTTYKKAIRNFRDIVGNTGIRTNVIDLSKWLIHFENLGSGKDNIGTQLLEPTVLTNGKILEYCLGLKKVKYNEQTIIKHGGADIGFRSQVIRFPEKGISVIVLCNNGSLNADKMAHDIADIYLDNEKSATASNVSGASTFISEAQLDKYEGKFELQPGFVMEFNKKDGGLMITATGQGTLPLKTLSESKFEIGRIGAKITFSENPQGKVDSFTFEHNGKRMEGKRIKVLVNTSVLRSYVGTYYSPELKTSYQLSLDNGVLRATHQRQKMTELTPLNTSTFSGNTWFFGTIEFVMRGDAVGGFKASSGRAQNVWFKKVKD